MNLTETSLSKITALANEAAIRPGSWNRVVGTISEALGANGAALFTPEVDPDGLNLVATAGRGSSVLPEYATHWVSEDPRVLALDRSKRVLRPGEIFFADELVPLEKLQKTSFFNDFSKGHGVENLVGLKVVGEGDPFAPVTHLSLFETRGTQRPFGEAQRQALAVLWPHLQSAIQTYWTLRKAREFDRFAEGSLDALPQPAWVLQNDLTIDFANRAAVALMSSAPWLRTRARRLIEIGDLDVRALLSALQAADGGEGRRCVAAVPDAGRLRRALLRFSPLCGVEPYATAWPMARSLITLALPASDDVATLWMANLARRYRLTPTEGHVLSELGLGRSLGEIAEQMNVTYATVRTHMTALYTKTGCRRQGQLSLLVNGG